MKLHYSLVIGKKSYTKPYIEATRFLHNYIMGVHFRLYYYDRR
nr:MAG TPA: hypothetical protein [Caudoviricetes sp.]